MKIVKPSVAIMDHINGEEILKKIEICGKVCYKSEHTIGENTAKKFVKKILNSGHEAVIEHVNITVIFICDRGVSHEIVRHRIASYCQESTRYCSYDKEQFGGEITVIEPCFLEKGTDARQEWEYDCIEAEKSYFRLLGIGLSPQEARSVLPNSLKTEVVMTANLREWRHFLKLRTSTAAHPQMREVALMLLEKMKVIPVVFDDIGGEKQ